MKTTKAQLRARLLRWAEDIIRAAQPQMVDVTRVDREAQELWVDGYSKTIKHTGPYDVKRGDKIYKSRGRSAGALLGVVYNSQDDTLYPRLRADYLTSPAESLVLTAGTGTLTITSSGATYSPDGGLTNYEMTNIGSTEPGSLIWLEM